LTEPLGIAVHRNGARVAEGLDVDRLRLRLLPDAVEGLLDDRRQVHRSHVETQLAGDDAREIEQILNELRL